MHIRFPAACLGVAIASLGTAIALTVPHVAKMPPSKSTSVELATPELSELASEDGKKWAVIKLWKYQYDPAVIPNTDLKIIAEAINSGKYHYLILESEGTKGNPEKSTWGWYLAKIGDRWSTNPITKSFSDKYPEIFEEKNK
jgi:hypothetical protein